MSSGFFTPYESCRPASYRSGTTVLFTTSFTRYAPVLNFALYRLGLPCTGTSFVHSSRSSSFSFDVICLNSHSRGFPFSSWRVTVGAYFLFFFTVLFSFKNLLKAYIIIYPFLYLKYLFLFTCKETWQVFECFWH